MVIVFGNKIDGVDYQVRKAVYAVIFNSTNERVLTVQNSKGDYFLPGGGIENNENHQECLVREMFEETGYAVSIGSFIGNAKRFFQSTNNEHVINDGYFYLADLLHKEQEPIEVDHFIKWFDINNIKRFLVHEHHCWAVNEGVTKFR
ncbi:NUDIX hydrolase [Metabacillus malikii]|uniref:8-oxo-dGTP diphosphatase n=1 Tax=Metabacillus malikii TaxID=1504265 RepID=A0ABT9ZAD5_9BACI|nr:NUDIX domain-containing protein [Metabacillus malikii]MDQ0229209.1 8-oxo-dGTP diphosphatase [Metabacillus malikii]